MSGNSRNRGGRNRPLRRVEENPEDYYQFSPEEIEGMRALIAESEATGGFDPNYVAYLRWVVANEEARNQPVENLEENMGDGSVYSGAGSYENQVTPVLDGDDDAESLPGGKKKALPKKKGRCSAGDNATKKPFKEDGDDDVGSSIGRRIRNRTRPSGRCT